MTIETDLQELLAPLVGGRVSPDIGTGEGKPYITYQQAGGEAFRYLGPEAVGTKNARMQINVWSDTRNEAAALARQIEDLLVLQLQATPLGAMTAVHEPDTGLYGARQDFSIWYVT